MYAARVNPGKTYLDHYTRYLGEPSSRSSFHPAQQGGSIQLLDYAHIMADAHVLATLGLTHYHQALRERVEVVIPTSVLDELVLEAVAASLSFLLRLEVPIEGVTYLRHLHRSVPAFFERYEKSALAFTAPYPFPDDFGIVRLSPSGSGKVWMGFFLSEAEVQLIEHEGFDAFLTLLEAQDVDVIDLTRPSLV